MDDFWEFLESLFSTLIVWAFALAFLGGSSKRESLRTLKDCMN